MSRITGVSEQKANLFVRLAYWFSKKRVAGKGSSKVSSSLLSSVNSLWRLEKAKVKTRPQTLSLTLRYTPMNRGDSNRLQLRK
jgi:hypothetical protein